MSFGRKSPDPFVPTGTFKPLGEHMHDAWYRLTGAAAQQSAKAAECEEIERVFNEGNSTFEAKWNPKSGMLDGVELLVTQIQENMIGMGIADERIAQQHNFTYPAHFKSMLGQVLIEGNKLLTQSASGTSMKGKDHVFNAKVEHAYLGTVYFYSLVELYKECLPLLEFVVNIQKWRECPFEPNFTTNIMNRNELRNRLLDISQYMDQGVMLQLEELKQRLRSANGKHNPSHDGGKRRDSHRSRRCRSRRHRSRRCRSRRCRSRRCRTN
jgi:hypothetical protein